MIYARSEEVSFSGNQREIVIEMCAALARVVEYYAMLDCIGRVDSMPREDCEDILLEDIVRGAKARLALARRERR